MSNAVVLDTETTGLKGEVIELAMIPVDQFGNKKTGSEFESFFKPVGELSYAAMAVNNITPEMLESAPYFSEVEEGILPEKDTILIGHNIAFDISRLGDNWANYRTICTQKLAERLDMKSKGCDTYKNMGLFYF